MIAEFTFGEIFVEVCLLNLEREWKMVLNKICPRLGCNCDINVDKFWPCLAKKSASTWPVILLKKTAFVQPAITVRYFRRPLNSRCCLSFNFPFFYFNKLVLIQIYQGELCSYPISWDKSVNLYTPTKCWKWKMEMYWH